MKVYDQEGNLAATFTTVNCRLEIEEKDSLDPSATQVEPDTSAQSEGYKINVLDSHQILDSMDIPSAKGTTCQDPECKSSLGHRLRFVRDGYQVNKSLIARIESILKESKDKNTALYIQLKELLEGGRKH